MRAEREFYFIPLAIERNSESPIFDAFERPIRLIPGGSFERTAPLSGVTRCGVLRIVSILRRNDHGPSIEASAITLFEAPLALNEPGAFGGAPIRPAFPISNTTGERVWRIVTLARAQLVPERVQLPDRIESLLTAV